MRSKIAAMVAAAVAAVSAAGAARWARGRKDDDLELEVTRPVEAPPVSPEPASDPPASGSAPAASGAAAPNAAAPSAAEGADDLTAIKGLGKVKASRLVAAGVTSYAQIAAWTDDDIAEMGLACNTSPGQIKREDWVGQARALAGAE